VRVQYFVAAAAVATIGFAFYVVLFLRVPEERPLAYWPLNDRTLQVVFLASVNRQCEIAQVEESADVIRIHARCEEPAVSVPQTSMAQKFVLEVMLQAPLGSRTVLDGLDRRADKCQLPGTDCIAPP
jgi:hypothetical protein